MITFKNQGVLGGTDTADNTYIDIVVAVTIIVTLAMAYRGGKEGQKIP